ncbi:MAG: FKBP-type peptidyl-prolyl cis-trans isomerase [Chryseosolibacter sp.]
MRVAIGLLAVVPFIVASCMMNETDDIPDFNDQLQKDLAAIDSYLASNNISASKDVDGFIRYVIHRDSTGKRPTIDSCVTANYSGKLMSTGTEFDKGANVSFPLISVIDGWKIGIPLLDVGDSATLYIPSGLAYGYYGISPEIPSNANLIFHVGVTKVGSTYTNRSCN